jgi:DNA-binding transcriptional LysR family regulator
VDIYQLKTFVAVAREGSITRASELLHLSQPAVSAHIKAIEDAVGLALFERNARGMSLTRDGARLLDKAEHALGAHRELLEEARRIKGALTGTLRLGATSTSSGEAVGEVLAALAERCPEVEVALAHDSSPAIVAAILAGRLDGGFYNEPGDPDPALATIEVSRFGIWLASPPGLVTASQPPDWGALAAVPWIYPAAGACCGQTAERLFKVNRIRPRRILSVDREDVTRTLIAGGVGVGLLHSETANDAMRSGEVELLFETPTVVRVLFAHLASRAQDPLVAAATACVTAARR